MREEMARLVAWATGALVIAAVLLFAALQDARSTALAAARVSGGAVGSVDSIIPSALPTPTPPPQPPTSGALTPGVSSASPSGTGGAADPAFSDSTSTTRPGAFPAGPPPGATPPADAIRAGQPSTAADTPAPAGQPPEPAAQTPSTAPTDETLLALGRTVYGEQRCASCHSIAGVGSPRSPLDGVGSRLTTEQIRLWIVDPQAMRPGIRKRAFDDLPATELEALIAYMQSLR